MSNTALSIVLSVLCVIIILRRGRTWGNTLAKSNIKVVSTFNKFSYSLFEGWKVIAQLKRFELLDMRQPTSNFKAPLKYLLIQFTRQLDFSKLGSTQQQKICRHWHVARIISSQKIYGLYARKYHIVEMRGDVTNAGQPTNDNNWR